MTIRNTQWNDFTEALRTEWPTLTDFDLDRAQDLTELKALIAKKYNQDESVISEKLYAIVTEVRGVRPISHEDFPGIERAQHSGPTK